MIGDRYVPVQAEMIGDRYVPVTEEKSYVPVTDGALSPTALVGGRRST
jgi:hypothetical protein